MSRKSTALQKIEDHEKLCRLMQKETFQQIKELKAQVIRMERILIAVGVFLLMEFDSARNFFKSILEILS
jgi:hypothetical protein